MSTFTMVEGVLLTGVHPWTHCQMDLIEGNYQPRPRACVIHRPDPHHMRTWELSFRSDRGIFDRHCEHGTGHPDPSQFEYWRETNQAGNSIHSCCGCCRLPFPDDQEVRWSTWPAQRGSTVTSAAREHSGGLESALVAGPAASALRFSHR